MQAARGSFAGMAHLIGCDPQSAEQQAKAATCSPGEWPAFGGPASAAPVCALFSHDSGVDMGDRNLIIRDSSQSDCTQTFCKMSRAAQKHEGGWFRYSETASTYQIEVFAYSSDLKDFKPLRTFPGS